MLSNLHWTPSVTPQSCSTYLIGVPTLSLSLSRCSLLSTKNIKIIDSEYLHLSFSFCTSIFIFFPPVSGDMSIILRLTGLPSQEKNLPLTLIISVLLLSCSSFHSLLSWCKKQFLQTSVSRLLPPPTELESYPPSRVTYHWWSNRQLPKALIYLLFYFLLLGIPLFVTALSLANKSLCTSQNSQCVSQICMFPCVFPPSQIYSLYFFHLKHMPSLSVPLQTRTIHKGPIQMKSSRSSKPEVIFPFSEQKSELGHGVRVSISFFLCLECLL